MAREVKMIEVSLMFKALYERLDIRVTNQWRILDIVVRSALRMWEIPIALEPRA